MVREDRTFRLPDGVGAGSGTSVGPADGGSIEEGFSPFSGGVGTSSWALAGVPGTAGELRFNLLRLADHRPVMDRFKEFEPLLGGY